MGGNGKLKRQLPPVIDFDLYGHCIICHKNMLIEEMIDGKMQIRLSGQHRSANYLLDNGSNMSVTMCVQCKESRDLTDEENQRVMKTAIAGWEIETDDLVSSISKPHWNKTIKRQYMDARKDLSIVMDSENVPQDILTKRLHGFLREKERNKNKKKKDK